MKKKQFKLPNNMQVSYLNRAEVTYTYDEIFVELIDNSIIIYDYFYKLVYLRLKIL